MSDVMPVANKMSAEDIYGKIIFENSNWVIRIKESSNTEQVQIFRHHKKNGKEWIPGGYVSGFNYLGY